MATHMNFSPKKQSQQSGNQNNVYAPESNKVRKQAEIKNIEEWEKQIWYWRTHLDVFIQEYFSTPEKPIKLFPFQQVIARNCGNCSYVVDVESRSLGKTWKMALILFTLAVLYPENKILIISKTVGQAILTIKYIETMANSNPNMRREIIFPIKVDKNGATINFKSGAIIEAAAMGTDGAALRGRRAKVVYADESLLLKNKVIQDVIMPILQYKRDIYWKYKDNGFEDFDSKFIQTSSAYLKTCDFYTRFKNTLKNMKNGDPKSFCCSISYKTGVRYGIIDESFVETQKSEMVLSSFEMEWNSKFIGSTEGSYFPYDLTEPCRNLDRVELAQPKNSKSRYILSLDIATSAANYADNACLCVVKISEKPDGTFHKYLVYIKTFHGYKLEALALEVRKACVRFPNIEKLVIDIRALGEGILACLNAPYVDEDTGKEYPPFVLDDVELRHGNVLPIIRGIRADNKENSRMATATRLFLENKSLHLPVASVAVRKEKENVNIESSKKKSSDEDEIEIKRNLLLEEIAMYTETDALQFELSTIVPKVTASGNVVYDTLMSTQHKDRYTALAQALSYILELEEINKENSRDTGDECLAVSYKW